MNATDPVEEAGLESFPASAEQLARATREPAEPVVAAPPPELP